MHLINGFREKMHDFVRKRRLNKQASPERKTCGLSKAAKIGVIFKYEGVRQHEELAGFSSNLRQNNIHTELMAYVSKPEKYKSVKIPFPVFSNKDLSWLWFPKSKTLLDFMHKDFDILISLCTEKCIPIETVAALSNAGFRVGTYDSRSVNCYDFMIDSTNRKDSKKLIGEIVHYLNMIQS